MQRIVVLIMGVVGFFLGAEYASLRLAHNPNALWCILGFVALLFAGLTATRILPKVRSSNAQSSSATT